MDKKEKMFSLVAQWRNSGSTRKIFAQQHNLQLASFNYWCKKQYNEVFKPSLEPAFVEITSDSGLVQHQKRSETSEVTPEPSTNSNRPQIELSLASGLLIKIY